MEFIKLSELKEYELNKEIRTISAPAYKRLKESLTKYGQIKALLVTDKNMVIGGNHRLKAMNELGWQEAKCERISFMKEFEGYVAVLRGEAIRTHFYKTEEAGLFDYSIRDNEDTYATYNKEKLMMYADTYNVGYEEIHVNVEQVPSFLQVVTADLNSDKIEEKKEEELKKKLEESMQGNQSKVLDLKCPNCNFVWKKEL